MIEEDEEEQSEEEFICPECKSLDYEESVFLSKEPTNNKSKNKDPWASVLQQVKCSSCNMIIPNHLGMRYGNITYDKAVTEWKNVYRKDSSKQKI